MTAQEKLKKYKAFPSTLIINGLNDLGIQVTKTLLEQKGFVIILDRYTEENKGLIDELSKEETFTFVNINGNDDFIEKVGKLNYLVYFEHENIENQPNLSPNEFLKEINYVNKFLELAIKNNTKVLITTSLKTHQLSITEFTKKAYSPQNPIYSDIEQQRYIEKLSFDLHKKYNLDIRIIRLGEVYGKDCTLKDGTNLKKLLEQAITSKYLKIYGDGLEENFIIHVNDATYGLIKALFSSNTNGEVFNLANYEDTSTLSIAYSLLETDCKAKEIKFLPEREKPSVVPLDLTPNLSKIGWSPRIPLAKGFAEIIDNKEVIIKEENKRDLKNQDKKSLWQKFYNFFFITEEQFQLQQKRKQRPSILEKLSKQTVKKKRVSTEAELATKIVKEKKQHKTLIKFDKKVLFRKLKIGWKKKLIIGILILISYIFIFAPAIKFTSNVIVAGINGYKAISALKESNYDDLSSKLQSVETDLAKAQNSLSDLKWIFAAFNQREKEENLTKMLAGTRHLARGGYYSMELISPLIKYLEEFSLNTTESISYEDYMNQIQTNAKEFDIAYIELIKANQLLGEVNYDILPIGEKQKKSLSDFQTSLFEKIQDYKGFISVLPKILGYPKEQKYLIVFQNNYEIRSTGGFIGSYGILDFEKGKLKNIKIDDIYNPDGQLTEYIEPPEGLKEFLGENTSWAMRDANWEPDFPTSARQLEWFYELETGEEVDGVIAINTNIIQDLLEITGAITLDTGEIITEENFFDQAEQHHLDFTPGSTEKKDFLGDLAQEIFEVFNSKDRSVLLSSALKVEELLDSREIFIYLNDSSAQNLISGNEWDGGIYEHEGEYLFIVENNISANKVNKYLERKIYQNLNLSENNSQNELTIEYINNSTTNQWPGGTYISYVQIFIPLSAENIEVEGIENFKISERYNYKVIAGNVSVAKESIENVEINYEDKNIAEKPVNKLEFNHFIQKQSGISDTYLDINVTYPTEWKVLNNESSITQKSENEKLSYFGLLRDDATINLEFSTEK